MRMLGLVVAVFGFAGSAGPVRPDYSLVQTQPEFIKIVSGKTLARPLVRLVVAADGTISGRGAAWDITGTWVWQDAYFCRNLTWGKDDLGFNCQQVENSGDRIRFISERGMGASAEFRLD